MIQKVQKVIKISLRQSTVIGFGINSVFAFQVTYKGGLFSVPTFGKQKICGMDILTTTLFYAAIVRCGP